MGFERSILWHRGEWLKGGIRDVFGSTGANPVHRRGRAHGHGGHGRGEAPGESGAFG
ncbi:conserved protein of unknown function [Kyrpidia spormannii]|uniref:Uncharacterized protein n=1 Tax=Kyrpidia spormannii TaxID=2055160 RepID=A0ACA8Z866_9BACL|nr:conserved protein of unknown function [Kyrpidia spormannii]